MRIWFNDLVRWLPLQDKAYRSLVERGYYVNRDRTIVTSIVQALDISEGFLNNATHSFSNPAPRVYTQSAAAYAAAVKRTNDELAAAALSAGPVPDSWGITADIGNRSFTVFPRQVT